MKIQKIILISFVLMVSFFACSKKETTPENVKFLYTPMECEGCLGVCSKPLENNIYPCVARIEEAAVLDAVSS